MSRRIVTIQLQARGAETRIDGYWDRVIKYIPSDVVAGWTAATGIISGAGGAAVVLWIAFACGLALTAAWTWRQTSEPKKPPAVTQIVVATLAFIVWVFALGGPFATLDFYRAWYGSLMLILFTLSSGVILPRE